MVKFQAKRLQKLADLLKIVPKKRFNIESWARGKFCNVTRLPEVNHSECGASACAFGWACTIPSFKKSGLKMGKRLNMWGVNVNEPKYKGFSAFEAAGQFFGLEAEEAGYLFAAENPNSAKKAARRIERLIKAKATGKEIKLSHSMYN